VGASAAAAAAAAGDVSIACEQSIDSVAHHCLWYTAQDWNHRINVHPRVAAVTGKITAATTTLVLLTAVLQKNCAPLGWGWNRSTKNTTKAATDKRIATSSAPSSLAAAAAAAAAISSVSSSVSIQFDSSPTALTACPHNNKDTYMAHTEQHPHDLQVTSPGQQ
jgi:hypothetical protein